MSRFWFVLGMLLALLSAVAGVAKLMGMPQEAAFFQQLDIPLSLMIVFGILQIGGGVMVAISKIRKWGLILVALLFLLSSIQISATGNFMFA